MGRDTLLTLHAKRKAAILKNVVILKKGIVCTFITALICLKANAAIVTAADYFKEVSSFYATIKDYEADVAIKNGNKQMYARVSYKSTGLLRLDFSKPQNQTIVFNGDFLTIYLPQTSSVLQQKAEEGQRFATSQGLNLMSRYYIIAYEEGQEELPLEEGSDEKVIKLVLTRRTANEAFYTIKLSINAKTKLIRRVEANSTSGVLIVFDFTNYRLNTGIPDNRFIYDPPSSANVYNNFLFSE